MCCCIPLRRLSYLGALMHMLIGLLYLYYLGKTAVELFVKKDEEKHKERLVMGLLYMGYFSAFLPPGVFIFWGVHKSLKPKQASTQTQSPSIRAVPVGLTVNQLRIFIVWPSIAFLLIQVFGLGMFCWFRFSPWSVDEAMKLYNDEQKRDKMKLDYLNWVMIDTCVTTVYLFMLYFYYREIGPDPDPVISRYAQQAQMQQQPNFNIAQQLQHTHMPLHHAHPHHSHPSHAAHNLGGSHAHLTNVYHQPTVTSQQQSQQPLSLSSSTGGGTSGSRTNMIIPPAIPPFSPMGPLASLSYEQQQQLLKIQQQQQLLAQQQHLQQQHQQQHSQYQNQYAQMLPNQNSKNPKF